MRKWYKYWLESSVKDEVHLDMHNSYSEIEKAMGGYDIENFIKTTDDFFEKYYFGYHSGRLENYDKFIRKHLNQSENILSLACGRSANELYLLKDGFKVICSDMDFPASLSDVVKLFPDFKFRKLDILKNSSEERFDSIICLSLIFLFDDSEIEKFFFNVHESLNPGGKLILDSSGSSDNLLSNFIHDYLLRYEMVFLREIYCITKREKRGLVKKHHGYRRSDIEIISIAEKCGFQLVEKENYDFLTEFRRSFILKRLINNSMLRKFFLIIGKSIPYIRMFNFKRI